MGEQVSVLKCVVGDRREEWKLLTVRRRRKITVGASTSPIPESN